MLKHNLDGDVANKTQSKGVADVVYRDKNGSFQGAYAMVFDTVNDPATLEVYACRKALKLTMDLNFHKLKIASDCLSVINEINEEAPQAELHDPSRHRDEKEEFPGDHLQSRAAISQRGST